MNQKIEIINMTKTNDDAYVVVTDDEGDYLCYRVLCIALVSYSQRVKNGDATEILHVKELLPIFTSPNDCEMITPVELGVDDWFIIHKHDLGSDERVAFGL